MTQQKAIRETVSDASGEVLESQVAKLRSVFPEVFVEGKIDFDKLKATLGGAAESGPGRFSFSWAGKDDALGLLQTPSRATLLPCRDESVNFEATGNAFIEGDNLEVLKLLFKPYFGRVKLIYIDPPYNTGKDFVYPDNFKNPLQNYLEITEQVDSQGNLLTSNPETSGRYHSAWLSMMYPRLFARELLRDDGVILISIDDFEAHHLRLMMNEIFGEENFVAQLVWEKGRKNDAKLFSVGHEYVLVYARSKTTLRENKTIWREPKPGAQEIWDHYLLLREKYNADDAAIEKSLGEWYQQLPKGHPSKALSRYRHVDKYGPWRDRDISWPGGGGPRYDVPHRTTGKPCRVPEAGWRFAKSEEMQRQIAMGLVEFREDDTEPPFRKAHLKPRFEELDDSDDDDTDSNEIETENDDVDDEHEEVGLQVMGSYIYKQSQVGVKYLKSLFGRKLFDNPKDHEVLARLIRYITDEDDLVLDFFAGSASTAEAILRLNHSDRRSNRRFLLVQLPEPTRRRKPNGKYRETAAFKAGFKNIADLSKERIRRVIASLKTENQPTLDFPEGDNTAEDLGFKVFKLAKPNIEQWVPEGDRDPDSYAKKLGLFDDPLVAGWTTENVLWEIALREGFGLSATFEKKTLANDATIYEVTDPDKDPPQTFAVCLDGEVQVDFGKYYPLSYETLFICRDKALDDTAAANLALQCRLKTI